MKIIKCKIFTNSKIEKIEFNEKIITFKFYINTSLKKRKANKKPIELISKKLNFKKNELKILTDFTSIIKLIKVKNKLNLNLIKEKLLIN